MKINKVHHIAILVSNYEISKQFYTEQLGFKIIRENYREDRKSYKLDLAMGDIEMELFYIPGSPPRLSYPEACGLRHLCFQVDNIAEAVEELNQKNIKTEPVRIDEYTGKKFTFLFDPDNLPLELHE